MPAAGEVYTLRQALETARRDNPEILAAAKRVQAAESARPQSYLPDKPMLTYESMYDGGHGGAQEKNLLITQNIPFPSTLYWQAKNADADIEYARQDYRAAVLRVSAGVKTAYAALFCKSKVLGLIAENIDTLKRITAIAEAKYSVNHATRTDVLKAQTELAKTLALRIIAEQELGNASAKLNTLTGRAAQNDLNVAQDYVPPALAASATCYYSGTLENPQVLGMRSAVQRSSNGVELARAQYYPDIMLGYRKRSSDDAVMDGTHDFMFGLALPLWYSKQRSQLEQARTVKKAAGLDLESAADNELYAMREAFAKAAALGGLLELYSGNIIPQAQQSLEASETDYKSGGASFMDLLDAQRALKDFRMEYYDYLAQYAASTAELERISGGGGL